MWLSESSENKGGEPMGKLMSKLEDIGIIALIVIGVICAIIVLKWIF